MSTQFTSLRVLSPTTTVAFSKALQNIFRNIKLPIGTTQATARGARTFRRTTKGTSSTQATPQATTAPRTITRLDFAKRATTVGGVAVGTAGILSFTDIITTPQAPGTGTTPLQDLTKGASDIVGNIAPIGKGVTDFLTQNPTGVILIAGGIVLLLLIK